MGEDDIMDDVAKMFEVKNKEIFRNKLQLDIDNNVDSLIKTITNILNLEFMSFIKKMERRMDNDCSCHFLSDSVSKKQEIIMKQVVNSLDTKKNSLRETIVNLSLDKNCIEDYRLKLEKTTELLQSEIYNCLNFIISDDKELFSESMLVYVEDFKMQLYDKINSQIELRDMTLLNNARESRLKFDDLCKNTQ